MNDNHPKPRIGLYLLVGIIGLIIGSCVAASAQAGGYGRHYGHHHHRGWGGFAAGAIIGGALAYGQARAYDRFQYNRGRYYAPPVYGPAPAYVPPQVYAPAYPYPQPCCPPQPCCGYYQ